MADQSAYCPICKDPLDWHKCTGTPNGCTLEQTRARRRENRAYLKRSARLTSKEERRPVPETLKEARWIVKQYETRMDRARQPSGKYYGQSKAELTHRNLAYYGPDRWRSLDAECNKDSDESRALRRRVLEWLRYESLRLARRTLTNEQRRDQADDLEVIKGNEYHELLSGRKTTTFSNFFISHRERSSMRKFEKAVVELKAERFKVLQLQTKYPGYVERTLLVPGRYDVELAAPDRLAETICCLSLNLQCSDDDIWRSLKQLLDKRRRGIGRKRGHVGGRRVSLSSMADALQRYETLPSDAPKKAMAKDSTPHHYKEGSRKYQLAHRMLEAAKAGPIIWFATFR